MFMTFEKVETPPAPKPEHPAARAARMIKELHLQNIDLMDKGHIFMRDGVDVNDEMRASCREQIAHCDRIIERAEHMDPKLWSPAQLILSDLQDTVAEAEAKGDQLASILPEIGNYEHDKEPDA